MASDRDDSAATDRDDEAFGTRCLMALPLSDAELHFIGQIIAYWGRIEHEVFGQALLSFGEDEEVPSALGSNRNFPAVQRVWRERVISRADDERRTVLEREDAKITHYYQFRPAIAHAMWDWEMADTAVIISRRIVNKQVITVKLTKDDLASMASALGETLYWVTYPGGLADRGKELAEAGGYMSRHFVAMMKGDPRAVEYLPAGVREALKNAEER